LQPLLNSSKFSKDPILLPVFQHHSAVLYCIWIDYFYKVTNSKPIRKTHCAIRENKYTKIKQKEKNKVNRTIYCEHNEKSIIVFLTCPALFADLFEVSGEHELSWRSSSNSSSFLMSFSTEKPEPCRPSAFLVGFVLLPVMVDCVDTLGVLTTKDESDLSFLLAGNSTEGIATAAFCFLLLKGKILFLKSCKLLSGLGIGKTWNKLKEKSYFRKKKKTKT